MIVNQLTPAAAVQVQLDTLAVTATEPVDEVAACEREVGEIENEHDAAPDWFTVNV